MRHIDDVRPAGEVGALVAHNERAGSRLVQRLPGPVGSYYIDVLPDSASGCGLYQDSGAEQRQRQDPGRMSDPAKPFTSVEGRVSGRFSDRQVQAMLKHRATQDYCKLADMQRQMNEFWKLPQNQGRS
jgi:hypothetical protein